MVEHISWNLVPPRAKLMFRRTIFRYLLNYNDVQRQQKQTLMYFRTRPSIHDSRCSTTIHQKKKCGSRQILRSHRSQQDQDICGRKNGQTCQEGLSVKPNIFGRKKRQRWTRREKSEAFTLFWTRILIVTTSRSQRFNLEATLCKSLV